MSKPRPPQTIEKAEFVSIGELAVLSNSRYSTLKFYTEIGLLPFIQTEQKRNRKYDKVASLTRIELIKKLKIEQRLTIEEIKKHFQKN